jgi:Flp pilus assembly pilin Flp
MASERGMQSCLEEEMFEPAKLSLSSFWADENGSVAIEYTILAATMFLAIIPAIFAVRTATESRFAAIAEFFSSGS